MIDKLNDYKLDDEIMDKIEGGIGSPADAKQAHLISLGNIFHFGKNTAGNNNIFNEGTGNK